MAIRTDLPYYQCIGWGKIVESLGIVHSLVYPGIGQFQVLNAAGTDWDEAASRNQMMAHCAICLSTQLVPIPGRYVMLGVNVGARGIRIGGPGLIWGGTYSGPNAYSEETF